MVILLHQPNLENRITPKTFYFFLSFFDKQTPKTELYFILTSILYFLFLTSFESFNVLLIMI